jgi:hypothetical protein
MHHTQFPRDWGMCVKVAALILAALMKVLQMNVRRIDVGECFQQLKNVQQLKKNGIKRSVGWNKG